MSQVHRLKCWSQYFDAIKRGDKPFEVRKDDRGYQKGDQVVLVRVHPLLAGRFDPVTNGVTLTESGDELTRTISYIMAGGKFGVEPGFVVLAIPE